AMSREQFDRGLGVSPEHSRGAAKPQALGQDAQATGKKDWQGQLKFLPARYAKTFQTWNENIGDWCISRQLWWGHRIPVWIREQEYVPLIAGKRMSKAEQERRASAAPPADGVYEWESDQHYVIRRERTETGKLREYVCIEPGH